MYPTPQVYRVQPPPLAAELEGAFRPGFFDGVCTVVLKLLNLVQPDVVVFGKKDRQQLKIVRGMVQQFNMPILVVPAETVRADDGLALSSRNGYLSPTERAEAPRLYRTLRWIADEIAGGRTTTRTSRSPAARSSSRNGWNVDYVAVRHGLGTAHPASGGLRPSEPADRARRGEARQHPADRQCGCRAEAQRGLRRIDDVRRGRTLIVRRRSASTVARDGQHDADDRDPRPPVAFEQRAQQHRDHRRRDADEARRRRRRRASAAGSRRRRRRRCRTRRDRRATATYGEARIERPRDAGRASRTRAAVQRPVRHAPRRARERSGHRRAAARMRDQVADRGDHRRAQRERDAEQRVAALAAPREAPAGTAVRRRPRRASRRSTSRAAHRRRRTRSACRSAS